MPVIIETLQLQFRIKGSGFRCQGVRNPTLSPEPLLGVLSDEKKGLVPRQD